MSLEAVPCKFMCRAEDGNETSLYGLLIRPSPSTSSSQQSQQISITSGSIVNGIATTAANGDQPSSATTKTTTAAIQIVPNSGATPTSATDATTTIVRPRQLIKKKSAGSIARPAMLPITPKTSAGAATLLPIQPNNGQWPKAGGKLSNAMLASTSSFPQAILPRSVALLDASGKKTTAPGAQFFGAGIVTKLGVDSSEKGFSGRTSGFSTINNSCNAQFDSPSPSQVVPQLNAMEHNAATDPLSIATTSSAYLQLSSQSQIPSTVSTRSTGGGLLTLSCSTIITTSSPPDIQPSPPVKRRQGRRPKVTTDAPKTEPVKKPRGRRIKQFLAATANAVSPPTEEITINEVTARETETEPGGEMLGEDLNSIDLNQLLANSAVITTEDYLQPRHSSSIYTSTDMFIGDSSEGFNNLGCGGHTNPSSNHQQLLINDQQQHVGRQFNQENSMYLQSPSVRYPGPNPVSNMSSIQHLHHQTQQHWHPYMGSHPGVPSSQFSSCTPDSGIQSIDGSPPSVISSYTPPMVSPYTTQVTSCESFNTAQQLQHHHQQQHPLQQQQQNHGHLPVIGFGSYATGHGGYLPEKTTTFAAPVIVAETRQLGDETCDGDDGDDDDDLSDMPKLKPFNAEYPETATETEVRVIEDRQPSPPATPSKLSSDSTSVTSIESANESLTDVVVGTLKTAAEEKREDERERLAGAVNSGEITLDGLAERLTLEQLQQLVSLIQSKKSKDSVASPQKEGIGKVGSPTAKDATEVEEQEMTGMVASGDRSEDRAPNCVEGPSTSDYAALNGGEETAEEQSCRLAEYRRQVRAQLNHRLFDVLEVVLKRFGALRLGLNCQFSDGTTGQGMQRLDWTKIGARISVKSSTMDTTLPAETETVRVERRGRKKRRGRIAANLEETKEKSQKKLVENVKLANCDSPRRGRRKKVVVEETGPNRTEKMTEKDELPKKRGPKPGNGRTGEATEAKHPTMKKPPLLLKIKVQKKRTIREHDYLKIRSNVFVDAPPPIRAVPFECECPRSAPCDSSLTCCHRAERVECTATTCDLPSIFCQNRRISNNQACHQLQIVSTTVSKRGVGVCTTEQLTEGQYICEFVGECVRAETYVKRNAAIGNEKHRYGVELVPGFVLDATSKGNISRFFNHSCQPNCELQKWLVNGHYRLGIFARRPIDKGEELTYDYGEARHVRLQPAQLCHCGSVECRGFISSAEPNNRGNNEAEGERTRMVPVRLTAEEVATVRSDRTFLVRNLQRNHRRSMWDLGILKPSDWCPKALCHLLTALFGDLVKFCAQKEHFPRRMLGQLTRTVRMALRLYLIPSQRPKSTATLIERFDRGVKQCLGLFQRFLDKRLFDSIRTHYNHLKASADLHRACPSLPKESIQAFIAEEKRRPLSSQVANLPSKRDTPKVMAVDVDLSYMDSSRAIGTYDPDRAARPTLSEDDGGDGSVRCICGMVEDDGDMTQCDRCQFWLHADCHDAPIDAHRDFHCDFCTRCLDSTPRVDIVLRPQPEIKLSGCIYYRTLVNSRGLQVRLNEAVYVERLINDRHKSILRTLHEDCVKPSSSSSSGNLPKRSESFGGNKIRGFAAKRKLPTDADQRQHQKAAADPVRVKKRSSMILERNSKECSTSNLPNRWWSEAEVQEAEKRELFHRKDLRTFRAERLFTGPNGERFIFGCYYARPHETFCDSTRMFHRNELFWTPLFDTLPLDSVVGRCLILDPQIWATGRPKSPKYLEEDVFICEFQIDKNQRSFEKVLPKNRYYVNTNSYAFDEFPNKLTLKRDFTPFVLPSSSSQPRVSMDKTTSSMAVRDRATSATKEMHAQHLEAISARIRRKLKQQNNVKKTDKSSK